MVARGKREARRPWIELCGLCNHGDAIPGLRSSRYIGTRSPGATFCRRSAAHWRGHPGSLFCLVRVIK